MIELPKVAWLLGEFTPDIAHELERKGYQVRTFDPQKKSPVPFFDEHPDMVLVAEVGTENFGFVAKINQLFPQALVVSMPRVAPPETLAADNARLRSAEERLISSLDRNKESL